MDQQALCRGACRLLTLCRRRLPIIAGLTVRHATSMHCITTQTTEHAQAIITCMCKSAAKQGQCAANCPSSEPPLALKCLARPCSRPCPAPAASSPHKCTRGPHPTGSPGKRVGVLIPARCSGRLCRLRLAGAALGRVLCRLPLICKRGRLRGGARRLILAHGAGCTCTKHGVSEDGAKVRWSSPRRSHTRPPSATAAAHVRQPRRGGWPLKSPDRVA